MRENPDPVTESRSPPLLSRCQQTDHYWRMLGVPFRRGGIGGVLRPVVFAAAVYGCHQPVDPISFKVGLLAHGEGALRDVSGIPSRQGAEFALRSVADEGQPIEIDGRPVTFELVVREHGLDVQSATSAARRLINQDQVDVIVGPQTSDHAIAVARLAEAARVPMITPMSSNPATTRGRTFVFRLAFLDEVQGTVLGTLAFDEVGARRAAVLFDESNQYSRGLANTFVESFQRDGGEVVASESYTTDNASDFASELRRIAASDPEVLLLPNYPDVLPLQLRTAHDLGVDAVFLGGDTWDVQELASMPEVEEAFVTHQWSADVNHPDTRAFISKFRDAYGVVPRATAAMTYDAVRLIIDTVRKTGTRDPAALRDGLRTARFTGVTGEIVFDGNGDPTRGVAVTRIADGAYTVVGFRYPDVQ